VNEIGSRNLHLMERKRMDCVADRKRKVWLDLRMGWNLRCCDPRMGLKGSTE